MVTRPLPSLTAIKAFEAAAAQLSVTRGAEVLGVTPGAISQQIRDLAQLQCRLRRLVQVCAHGDSEDCVALHLDLVEGATP